MIKIAIPLLSLVALGAAQSSSTVSLFLPFADPQSLVGSIAGSDSTATTYVVNCALSGAALAAATSAAANAAVTAAAATTGFDDGDGVVCGFTSPFTVVQGPSTVHYDLDFGADMTSLACQLMGSTRAICSDSATGPAVLSGTEPAQQTATLSGTDVSFAPVVITAGLGSGKQTGSGAPSPSATAKTTASTAGGKVGTSSTSSATATAKSTNAAVQGSPACGAGVLGALGVALAGAML